MEEDIINLGKEIARLERQEACLLYTSLRRRITMNNKLYLAYGSNLNLKQMANRCPTAKVVGASQINDHRLLFRGAHAGAVATIEPFKGGNVPVLVWEITPDVYKRQGGYSVRKQ